MARIKIQIPNSTAIFQTIIPIRITDLNYGNHLANDKVLTIAHEARVQYLQSIGYSEMNVGNGCGIIMADAGVMFKNEGKYGDVLQIELFIENITPSSLELLYHLRRQADRQTIALVKTGIVCYDYTNCKIAEWDTAFLKALQH